MRFHVKKIYPMLNSPNSCVWPSLHRYPRTSKLFRFPKRSAPGWSRRCEKCPYRSCTGRNTKRPRSVLGALGAVLQVHRTRTRPLPHLPFAPTTNSVRRRLRDSHPRRSIYEKAYSYPGSLVNQECHRSRGRVLSAQRPPKSHPRGHSHVNTEPTKMTTPKKYSKKPSHCA